MDAPALDKIIEAVLYEGYILYPYRASCSKNRQRFTFGRVYPEGYCVSQSGAEPCEIRTECLVECEDNTQPELDVSVRFLQPMWREVLKTAEGRKQNEQGLQLVPELIVDGKLYQTWQEALERKVTLPSITLAEASISSRTIPFFLAGSQTTEPLNDGGKLIGALVRRHEALNGEIKLSTEPMGARLHKLCVRVLNQTPVSAANTQDADAVLMRTFASTHTVLRARGANFLSLMDPADEFRAAASQCKNAGTWPVLVRDERERHTMLSSPIILYDYPKIAPESAGTLFDGTEIDELLTLRIMTMTDAEKLEMSHVDAQARRLLERTEALTQESLLNMHGALREFRSLEEQIFGAASQLTASASIQPGDRVRIRPKARADVMDIILSGKVGIVEAVEQDAENRVHLALVLEEDPGKDLGLMRQTGHRFFYTLDEVELLRNDPRPEVSAP
jgi:hypothetical protein